jgi:hypothetical protein
LDDERRKNQILIKGTVIYEGKETEANELSFTVPKEE